jgi:hypothetical protein
VDKLANLGDCARSRLTFDRIKRPACSGRDEVTPRSVDLLLGRAAFETATRSDAGRGEAAAEVLIEPNNRISRLRDGGVFGVPLVSCGHAFVWPCHRMPFSDPRCRQYGERP